MSNETTNTYITTYGLQGKNTEVVLGAFIKALQETGFSISIINNTYEVLAGKKVNTAGGELAVNIYTSALEPGVLKISIIQYELNLTEHDLAKVADELIDTANTISGIALEATLQTKFNETIAWYSRNVIDTQALPEEKKGWAWIKSILFSNNPAQTIAWIAIINIAVFVAMVIAGAGFFDANVEKVIQWGAADKALVVSGQYWRLLTACFIHFGIGHIVANMIGLVYATIFLVQVLDRWELLAGYLSTGIIAFAVSIWWHTDITTAGASGPIFGCYGILLGLALTPFYSNKDKRTILVYLAIYVGINLVYGMKDEVDNAAHLGGLLSGVPIGIMYYFSLRYRENRKVKYGILAAVVVFGIATTGVLMAKTTYSGNTLSILLNEYDALEKEGLAYYGHESDDDSLQEVELAKSLLAFKKAQMVADSMTILNDLNKEQRNLVSKIDLYTEYRVKEFELRKQYLENPSDTLVLDSLKNVNNVLTGIVNTH